METNITTMRIDSETYWTKDINRHKTQSPKTQIVLATSLRKESNHIIRLKHKEFGETKKWNTYTVSRNGLIYQHFDPKNHADFLGIKEADKQSISIVLENMGCLFETSRGEHINWIGETCDDDNVMKKNWLGYNYWEKFTDEQIAATAMLCGSICDEFGIHRTIIDFHHYHKDTIKYRGIVFRSNYIVDSSDTNPLFNIPTFNEMLQTEIT